MKQLIYIALLLITTSLTSCLDDDSGVNEFAQWQVENENFFLEKSNEVDAQGDTVYTKLHSLSYPELFILYKEVTAPQADGRTPYYNSTVSTDYVGTLYNDSIPFDDGENVEFGVNQVIAGWSLALQNMQEGAQWEVIIPWQLAYGNTGQGSIPPYSTLLFDMTLVEITKWETGTNPQPED